MAETFGFTRKERELTELEQKLGVEFVGTNEELFPNEIGRYVAVYVKGSSFYGVYQGLNKRGFLILLPHICSEFTSLSLNEQSKGITQFYWENVRSKYIKQDSIDGLSPVRKEYLEQLVEGTAIEDKKTREDKPEPNQ